MRLYGAFVGAVDPGQLSCLLYHGPEGDLIPLRGVQVAPGVNLNGPLSLSYQSGPATYTLRAATRDSYVSHGHLWLVVAGHKRLRVQYSRSCNVIPLATGSYGAAILVATAAPETGQAVVTFAHRGYVEQHTCTCAGTVAPPKTWREDIN